MRNLSSPIGWIAALILGAVVLATSALADSQVRIVRLSDAQGEVQVDRNVGQGFEKAFLNVPITQGVRLKTGEEGRAEVQFEDGSTLRLTPHTVAIFSELSRRSSGATASTVELQEGMMYVNFLADKNSVLTLDFGREQAVLTRPAHLRLEMGDTKSTLAVFKGEVKAEGPSGTATAEKKQTVTFDLANQDSFELAKNVEEDPFDSWDKAQSDYQQRYTSNSYSNYSPYAYGTTDLNYYGNYMDLPGYGTVWQPYFAGAGWDPFSYGSWLWYPGYGYSWVSGYPWGWTPYHYGAWLFVPGYGWCWQPGGAWSGWNTWPAARNAPSGFVAPKPPNSPGHAPVVVTRGGPLPGPASPSGRLRIANGWAGVGIPRGSVNNLGKLSERVSEKGWTTTTLHSSPIWATPSPSSGFGGPSRVGTPSMAPHPIATPHISTPHVSAPHSSPGPHR